MFSEERKKLIKDQLIPMGITDQCLINAIYEVPREKFIPEDLANHAYDNSPLPIGYNQTISQPYIVAFMTEAAKLTGNSRILEIGTGSGYQAAILSRLCKEVYTVEVIPSLAEKAQKIFNELKYNNINSRISDGYKGWPEQAPFDAIIVTAAPKSIPEELVNQLKINGRLIIPVGENRQELIRITKKQSQKIITEKLMAVKFVPMVKE
jgi:protein-L-isoaspartate(D-aspartate) O-methyltransferase